MMRIAISTERDEGLSSPVSAHFGRCPCFVIVEVQDGELGSFEVVENPFFHSHTPGQVPDFIRSRDVDVLISGGMGGRAVGFFEQLGIEAVTGAQGTVGEALRSYLAGVLAGAAPCRHEHDHGHDHDHGSGCGEGGGRGRRFEP
jgi:predicted Fe-Mo cluster-binding NifX family protein